MLNQAAHSTRKQKALERLSKRERITLLPYALILAIGFTLLAIWLGINAADFRGHTLITIALEERGELVSSHIVFQLLIIALRRLLPTDALTSYLFSGALIIAWSYALLGILCYEVFKRALQETVKPLIKVQAARFALAMLIIWLLNAITILVAFDWYWGYIVMNAHHSATTTLIKPMSLGLLLFAVHALRTTRSAWIIVLSAAVLCIITTFAKPNYTIALYPALVLVCIWQLWRGQASQINWRLMVFGLLLPMTLVLVFQFVWQTGNRTPLEIAPFKVAGYYGSLWTLPIKVLLSLVLPLYVTVAYWRTARHDRAVMLSWLTLALAYVPYLLLAEGGEGRIWRDANFIWGPQVAGFLLFVVTAAHLLRQAGENRKYRIALVLFGLHTLFGILPLILYFSGLPYYVVLGI